MSKRLRVEAAYRSKTLAYCGSNPRFKTSGPANSSTKIVVLKIAFSTRCVSAKRIWATKNGCDGPPPLIAQFSERFLGGEGPRELQGHSVPRKSQQDTKEYLNQSPDLLFLAFLDFLVFLLEGISLLF